MAMTDIVIYTVVNV